MPEHQEKFDNFKVSETPGKGLELIDSDSNKYKFLFLMSLQKIIIFWLMIVSTLTK